MLLIVLLESTAQRFSHASVAGLQPVLNSTRQRDSAQTVQKCASLCAGYGMPWAGLQASTDCYCSYEDPLADAVRAPDAECTASCGGESTTVCGRQWVQEEDAQWGWSARSSIYNILDMSKAGASDAALFKWEVPACSGAGGTKNPIYLGGHAYTNSRGEHGGSFVGNVANLGLFDDALAAQAVDCVYRQNQRALGSCRPPGAMWRTTFWNSFQDGTLRGWEATGSSATGRGDTPWAGVQLSGFVAYVEGVGLDFTGKSIDRDMIGASKDFRSP